MLNSDGSTTTEALERYILELETQVGISIRNAATYNDLVIKYTKANEEARSEAEAIKEDCEKVFTLKKKCRSIAHD